MVGECEYDLVIDEGSAFFISEDYNLHILNDIGEKHYEEIASGEKDGLDPLKDVIAHIAMINDLTIHQKMFLAFRTGLLYAHDGLDDCVLDAMDIVNPADEE